MTVLSSSTEAALDWFRTSAPQIMIAVAIAAFIIAILWGIRAFGMRLCRNDRLGTGWPAVLGKTIGRTRLWFVVLLAAELVAGYARPPEAIDRTIHFLFIVATAFQGAIWARSLVLGMIDHRAGADPDNQTLGTAMGLIRVLVTIALFAIAIVLILDNLGVNVTGLVAGLGIGGIAIGLAAQGIFSDLFAALAIIFDKPFRVGDVVTWDQMTGTVERIGLKTTRVRSLTGEQIIVSNAKLLERDLRNLTQLDHRRVTVPFGIIYQTPPETCAAIPDMLEEIVAANTRCSFTRCSMSAFGASSLDFELVFDIRTSDAREAADIKGAICIEILRLFRDKGIEFAYPSQTTFTAAPDGTLVMPWHPH